MFVGQITVEGEATDETQTNEGVRVVNINLPRSGVRAFKTTWDDSISPARWDIYTFDGEKIKNNTPESKQPRKGDILIIEKPLSSTKSDFFCGIFTTDNWDWKYLNAEGNIKSIVLKGSEAGEIPAEVDANGKAVIELEELEFEELHANQLIVGGNNVFNYIPNMNIIQEVSELDLTHGTTLNEVAQTLNALIGRIKAAASSQTVQPQS